jgi:NhaP-type Na+/H+ or K+/H+ antiporter
MCSPLQLLVCPPLKSQLLHLQAFPGVLIAMGSIAVLMRYSFPYGWSWTQALLFGAMMAATDPVATIAVLGSVSLSHVAPSPSG